jgi:hypothetical protein
MFGSHFLMGGVGGMSPPHQSTGRSRGGGAGKGSGTVPPKRHFWENCLVKYCNFIINLNHSSLGCRSDNRSCVRVFFLEGNPLLCMRELYSERGDHEKRRGSCSGYGVGCIPSFAR